MDYNFMTKKHINTIGEFFQGRWCAKMNGVGREPELQKGKTFN